MNSISAWTLPSLSECWRGSEESNLVRVNWPAPRKAIWNEAAQAEQLREIASLEDNWDGCGASAISGAAVHNAAVALNDLAAYRLRPSCILPTPSGTVAFEWETARGSAHLEIGTSTFAFYTAPVVGESIMYSGSIEVSNAEDIAAALATIVSSTLPHSMANRDVAVGF